MSRLNELVKELCPNGVEYKKLGDIEELGLIKLGRGNVISKTDIRECPGNYPIYSSSATGNGEFGRYGKYMFDYSQISWSIDGGGRFFLRKDDKYSLTNVSGWLRVLDDKVINIDYLYYVLTNEWQNKTFDYTHKAHPSVIRDEYIVPLPPLKIQQEIVKILDKFTQLQAELQAELELRLKQYEYYRDELLSFDNGLASKQASRIRQLINQLCPNGVGHKKLSEICDIKNGYTPSKSVYEYWNGDTVIPWFRMEDIRINGHVLNDSIQHVTKEAVKNGKLFPKNSIILATTATIGEHALITADSLANQQFTYLTIREPLKPLLDVKFFYYYMYVVDEWCKRNVNVSGFASVNMEGLKNCKIPLPPLEIQQEIVKILDKFSIMVSDISTGLPAEIKLRQQQYEYYRDELLSFKLTNV